MARGGLKHIDRPLIVVVAAIALLGVYNMSSAGRPLGMDLHYTHGLHIAVGVLVAAALASFHYRNLEGLAIPIFAACILLLLATSGFGKVVNGSRRWLALGPVTFQTSDMAKIAIVLIVARTFHLERWEGGLTLREIFRPFNVSRPLLAILAVLVLSLFGDAVRPPKLERATGNRFRAVAKINAQSPRLEIGRRDENDVRVPYSGVAKRHAELYRRADGEYVVRDLDTETGTFVNGTLTEGEVVLYDGDMLRFGLNQRSELRYSASMERIRPALPWVALAALIWLGAALVMQLRRGGWSFRDVVAPIDAVALPCILILAQPDLGTSLVVLLIAFTMILYVGLRPLSLVALGTSSVVVGALAWMTVLKPYQKQRVLTFLNPTSDLAGAGYHQNQSLIAIGSGELWGKGHGHGTQTQLSFLPEQQTDFIFSVWAEEQGFVGSALLVALFLALILLSLRIAARARDRFGALLAVGITAMFFWHTVVNMLMVLRLAPVVGVPLPLWSNGGSFIMMTMIGVGLLLNVSMRRTLF